MAFSGALTLTDLNDFITPSQACIKPVEQTNGVEPKGDGAASTEIRVDSAGTYYEVAANEIKPTQTKLQTAEISLNDCLACSGCITSAESVLISMQSHTEVLNFLASNPEDICLSHKVPVISIAPQSLASLAASISSSSTTTPVTLLQILRRVEAFCKEVLGFAHVFDITFARHLSLLEHAKEFTERKDAQGKLPMLASACPGWVCYAEKTHAEMLPFISQTKSPQQIMGSMVKEWMAPKWGKSPSQVYHVTVMPCYDKKLEASRQDFFNDIYSTRDVDCVLTTGELELMMREKGWDLSRPVPGENDIRQPVIPDIQDGYGPTSTLRIPELVQHEGSSSGSYLQSLISLITAQSPTPLSLDVRTLRTSDYKEYILTAAVTGEVVFKGAKCYGFRNLQNLVRKVGRDAGVQVGRGAAGRLGGVRGRGVRARKTADGSAAAAPDKGYDYVEVMACPSGCINGGGQLRPPVPTHDAEGFTRDWEANGVKLDGEEVGNIQGQAAKWGDKEWTKKVELAYWAGLPTPPPSPKPEDEGKSAVDALAVRILGEMCRSGEKVSTWEHGMEEAAEARRRRFFRTQYRAVESEVVGLAVKW